MNGLLRVCADPWGMVAYTYILASRPHGAIYIGSTVDLRARVEQHRSGRGGVHTARYGIGTLVWFEVHQALRDAQAREYLLKRWRRTWKDALIGGVNPGWRDVSRDIPY